MIDKCRIVNICYCLYIEFYIMCIIFMVKILFYICIIYEYLV